MKYVFANLSAFIKKETSVFIVTVICVLTSAILLNFSYGLYYRRKKKSMQKKTRLLVLSIRMLRPRISRSKNLLGHCPRKSAKTWSSTFRGQ